MRIKTLSLLYRPRASATCAGSPSLPSSPIPSPIIYCSMLRTARRPQVSAKVAQTIAKVTATSSRAAAAAAVEAAADSAAAPVSHARATAMLDVDEEEDGTGSASSSASSRGAASRGTLQQLPPATPGAARLRGAAAGGVGANVPASSLKALKPGAGFAAAASLVLPADENLDTGVGSSSSSSSSSFLGGSSKSSASSSSSASHAAPTDSSLVVELSLDDPATSVGKLTEAGGSDAVFSVMGSLLDGLFKAASAGNKSLESVMASSGLNPSLKAALMAFAAAEKSGAASSTGAAAAAPPAAPAPRTNMKLVATVSRAGLSEAPQRTAAVAPPAAAAAAPVAAPRPAGSKLAAVGAARSGR